MAERPTVIAVDDLRKSFRIPRHQVDTLKERVLHPFASTEYTTLNALRGISFKVTQGEFLGVAGRNGSGKSTMLKLLAGIYRADGGRIRVAGSLHPLIELGVGFNPNLGGRDNVLLNGVMMGLSPREARRRFDEIFAFAELEEFAEMKLKNYSSGMSMRLAFAVLAQSDADVMLVDEVLAVGDAAFAQKCADTFERFHDEGRTVLFVSHDMESMRTFCDRALLIEDGVIEMEGRTDEVARRYLQVNFAGSAKAVPATRTESGGPAGRIAEIWVEDDAGEQPRGFEHGTPFNVVAVIETERGIDRPSFAFDICATDGARLFAARPRSLAGDDGRLEPGERVTFRARISNPLRPGSYVINCGLAERHTMVAYRRPAVRVMVWGQTQYGYVDLDWESRVEREGQGIEMEVVRK